ncbi:MAG: BrnT family toxin [Bauldia sp.]|nr:BrnT family toxin [Bauldia sp.]
MTHDHPIAIAGIEWDQGNRDKCQRHGVSLAEIEALFLENRVRVRPDPAHSEAEERFHAIGATEAGRYVFLVFTLRERETGTFVRPISARYMHGKEIRRYEQQSET